MKSTYSFTSPSRLRPRKRLRAAMVRPALPASRVAVSSSSSAARVSSIASADKARKGFAPLMCAQMPRSAVVERQVDEGGERAVEVVDEIGGPADMDGAFAASVRHQPQLVASRASAHGLR